MSIRRTAFYFVTLPLAVACSSLQDPGEVRTGSEVQLQIPNRIYVSRWATGGTSLPAVPVSIRYCVPDPDGPGGCDLGRSDRYGPQDTIPVEPDNSTNPIKVALTADDGLPHGPGVSLSNPMELGVHVPDGYRVDVGSTLCPRRANGDCRVGSYGPYGFHSVGTGTGRDGSFQIPAPATWGPDDYVVVFRFKQIAKSELPVDESGLHCENSKYGQGMLAADRFVSLSGSGAVGANPVGARYGISSKYSSPGSVYEIYNAKNPTARIQLLSRSAPTEAGSQFSYGLRRSAAANPNPLGQATDYDLPATTMLSWIYNQACGARYAQAWGFETTWRSLGIGSLGGEDAQEWVQTQWTPNYPASVGWRAGLGGSATSPCYQNSGRWTDDVRFRVSTSLLVPGRLTNDRIVSLALTQEHRQRETYLDESIFLAGAPMYLNQNNLAKANMRGYVVGISHGEPWIAPKPSAMDPDASSIQMWREDFPASLDPSVQDPDPSLGQCNRLAASASGHLSCNYRRGEREWALLGEDGTAKMYVITLKGLSPTTTAVIIIRRPGGGTDLQQMASLHANSVRALSPTYPRNPFRAGVGDRNPDPPSSYWGYDFDGVVRVSVNGLEPTSPPVHAGDRWSLEVVHEVGTLAQMKARYPVLSEIPVNH